MPTTHDAVTDPRNADVQVYVDGEFHHRDDACVSVFDSAFLVGDGIWEDGPTVLLHEVVALVEAGPFIPDDLDRSEEAFVTGTFGGLTPVRELDGTDLGPVPGPTTAVLQGLHADALIADVAARAASDEA